VGSRSPVSRAADSKAGGRTKIAER
jgi:hypothetical protein